MAKLNWNPWMGLSDIKAELEQTMSEAARSGRAPGAMRGKAYFWTPAADVLSMFLVAVPMTVLFAAAVLVTHIADRRRARRELTASASARTALER